MGQWQAGERGQRPVVYSINCPDTGTDKCHKSHKQLSSFFHGQESLVTCDQSLWHTHTHTCQWHSASARWTGISISVSIDLSLSQLSSFVFREEKHSPSIAPCKWTSKSVPAKSTRSAMGQQRTLSRLASLFILPLYLQGLIVSFVPSGNEWILRARVYEVNFSTYFIPYALWSNYECE